MCWKKQHDVQPNLGHHGSALPSLKPFKFSSTAGAACQQLLGGDNDRSYMRQPVLAVKSMLVQHANRGVGKKRESYFLRSLRVKTLLASPGVKRFWKPATVKTQKVVKCLSHAASCLVLDTSEQTPSQLAGMPG